MDHRRSGLVLAAVLPLLQPAALAQEPLHYINGRFGFSADIPAGFSPHEPPCSPRFA